MAGEITSAPSFLNTRTRSRSFEPVEVVKDQNEAPKRNSWSFFENCSGDGKPSAATPPSTNTPSRLPRFSEGSASPVSVSCPKAVKFSPEVKAYSPSSGGVRMEDLVAQEQPPLPFPKYYENCSLFSGSSASIKELKPFPSTSDGSASPVSVSSDDAPRFRRGRTYAVHEDYFCPSDDDPDQL